MTAARSRTPEQERAYSARVRRLQAYGQWQPWADAEPVRHHVCHLRSQGTGLRQVAALAGIGHSTVTRLVYGEPARGLPPPARVRPATAALLLAVRPSPANLAPTVLVDAAGTRRRLQALCVMGWSGAALSVPLKSSKKHVGEVMAGVRGEVRVSTALKVRALYRELWDTPPPARTKAQRISVTYARGHAARKGWAPPLGWDDDRHIDDPAAMPHKCLRKPGGRVAAAVLVAEVEDITRMDGLDRDHARTLAAQRLGVTRDRVDKAYQRARGQAAPRRSEAGQAREGGR